MFRRGARTTLYFSKMKKYLFSILLGVGVLLGGFLIANAITQIFPYQIKPGTDSQVLTTSGTSTIWAAATGATSATTTINEVSGPTFTFNILGTNGLSYSTSTGTISLT